MRLEGFGGRHAIGESGGEGVERGLPPLASSCLPAAFGSGPRGGQVQTLQRCLLGGEVPASAAVRSVRQAGRRSPVLVRGIGNRTDHPIQHRPRTRFAGVAKARVHCRKEGGRWAGMGRGAFRTRLCHSLGGARFSIARLGRGTVLASARVPHFAHLAWRSPPGAIPTGVRQRGQNRLDPVLVHVRTDEAGSHFQGRSSSA